MSSGKMLWILCIANIAIALLLIGVLGASIFALGSFPSFVFVSPFLLVPPLGAVLSIIGLRFTKKEASGTPRRIGLIISGSALGLHSIVILGFLILFARTKEQRFLIPENYQGEVYVIHGVKDGIPEQRTFWGITYRVPADGMLRTQAPRSHRMTRNFYFYEHSDGTLERIRYSWSTISPTWENLSDNKVIGIYLPRSGTLMGPQSLVNCPVEFQWFYVGTKAYYLSGNRNKNLVQYLKEHPVNCDIQSGE